MNTRCGHRRSRAAGFSLIEILVVIVIMGLVVSAIMSLYVNMQKTSGSSEEVVEIQQGLRIALDRMALDLRMAGFLVTGSAVSAAGPNSITLRTATSNNTSARIKDDAASTSALPIDPPGMALMFDNGDDVYIINPASSNDCATDAPIPTKLTVSSSSAGTINLSSSVKVYKECMVVRAPEGGGAYPVQITYALDADPENPAARALVRRINGAATTTDNAQIGKISRLEFFYILDSGAVLTAVPSADLGKIRSVRVRMEASTIDTVASTGSVKTREAETTVKLYNR